ncbi:MAG: T9SS type A sorting domain-containing protein [Paludibacter sp.]|nr:T9SS type A sorting domain-containing protein [Paludibacter sp.]
MKTKLIIFLCLFLSVLNAQTFKSYFGKEYNKWYILYDGKVCPNTFNYLTCANRTTIIDGKTYQLLFEIYESLNDTIDSVSANTLSYQYLREDSVSGRLYYRYTINSDYGTSYSPEILVSDMSLHVGDSIPLNVTDTNLSLWNNLKLSTYDNKYYAIVDSVYFKDGLKHVRTSALFNSDYTNMFEKPKTALTFIEGVGSNVSPILDYNRFAYMSDISKLMCNVQDNNTIHFNISRLCRLYLYCDGVGVRETKDNHKFLLTLSDGDIKVKFTSSFSGSVRLIQSTGVVIYETPFVNATEQIINAQNLQSGVYILQIINSNGMITNRKLIL